MRFLFCPSSIDHLSTHDDVGLVLYISDLTVRIFKAWQGSSTIKLLID